MSADPPSLRAEWAPHARTWLAYPTGSTVWGADLGAAQAEVLTFCRRLRAFEPVSLLVPTPAVAAALAAELPAAPPTPQQHPVQLHVERYGDIWLRDTGPMFLLGGAERRALCLAFNGWGEKYRYADDQGLNARLAAAAGWPLAHDPTVFEGGAIEVDGAGLLLTTRQCLLRGQRNPKMTEAVATRWLKATFGAAKVVWLEAGLRNDHTDGHVDTLARFTGPGRVVCMRPAGPTDPNAQALEQVRATLARATSAAGRPLEVATVTSPGHVPDAEGRPMPASYLNFLIVNGAVLVPTYQVAADAVAVAELARLFPEREVIGLPARAILTGGGAFHCMSHDEPRPDNML